MDPEEFIERIYDIIASGIVPLLILIAGVIFTWGVIRYLIAAEDQEKIKEGRNMMIFGIVALTIILGLWGIVRLIVAVFGIDPIDIPSGVGDIF
ncbi:hypothetical protein ACFL3E_01800 [Patescibacteria group bacterium]